MTCTLPRRFLTATFLLFRLSSSELSNHIVHNLSALQIFDFCFIRGLHFEKYRRRERATFFEHVTNATCKLCKVFWFGKGQECAKAYERFMACTTWTNKQTNKSNEVLRKYAFLGWIWSRALDWVRTWLWSVVKWKYITSFAVEMEKWEVKEIVYLRMTTQRNWDLTNHMKERMKKANVGTKQVWEIRGRKFEDDSRKKMMLSKWNKRAKCER